jgi:outer membrane protein OmpA-like peptidoglycan-associated protein
MRIRHNWRTSLSSIGVLAVLAGCASTPENTVELERARDAVAKVAATSDSSVVASAELKEAQETLRKAEEASRENEPEAEVAHLAYMAEQQAAIAEAKMREAKALEKTKEADAQRNAALLEARERDAAVAQRDAALAEQRAARAETAAIEAWREVEEAKETERGIVLTLGDMLFDSGGVELKPGAHLIIDRLAAYLEENPDARAIIEGHTDNVGSPNMNQALSERRAEAVSAALRSRGIDTDRLETVGLGEAYPIATNDTTAGREENRRVEVVLSDSGGEFRESARRTASIKY